MTISVIVATRDRSADVARLLASLHGMDVPVGGVVEIIVADNGSTDTTRDTVERFPSAGPLTVRYLSEPRSGKSLALNRGVLIASGDVLAFVDDDILVADDWAEELHKAFTENAGLAGLGGRVERFNSHHANVTTRTTREPALIDLNSFSPFNPQILGCNMAFRAVAFKRVGLFDTNVGPGSQIGSGDDLDFLYRALRTGLEIQYLPDVLVYHNHGRSTSAQVLRRQRRYVKGRGAFYYKFASQGDLRVRKWAFRELRARILRVLRSVFQPNELRTSCQFLTDLVAGAIVSRRIHARGKSS